MFIVEIMASSLTTDAKTIALGIVSGLIAQYLFERFLKK